VNTDIELYYELVAEAYFTRIEEMLESGDKLAEN